VPIAPGIPPAEGRAPTWGPRPVSSLASHQSCLELPHNGQPLRRLVAEADPDIAVEVDHGTEFHRIPACDAAVKDKYEQQGQSGPINGTLLCPGLRPGREEHTKKGRKEVETQPSTS